MLIAVVGDCLLDISVRPSGPMRPGADAPAAIRLSPGGQGANVAVWLARQGASVRLIAPMADDSAGRLLREALSAEAVDLAPLPAVASGTVVALLDADGERTMLSDRVPLAVEGLPGLMIDASWIHVSGYALRDPAGPALARVLRALPDAVRVSIGGGSVPPGDEAASFAELLRAADPDLLIVSHDEAQALQPPPSCLTVVTNGRRGSMVRSPGAADLHVAAPALDRPVVDATGAGDAFAAGLIDSIAHLGSWPPPIGELRNATEAASRLGAEVARVAGAQGSIRR